MHWYYWVMIGIAYLACGLIWLRIRGWRPLIYRWYMHTEGVPPLWDEILGLSYADFPSYYRSPVQDYTAFIQVICWLPIAMIVLIFSLALCLLILPLKWLEQLMESGVPIIGHLCKKLAGINGP